MIVSIIYFEFVFVMVALQISGDDVVAVFPRFKCGLPVTVAKKSLVKGKIGPNKPQILAKENCHPKKNILKGEIVPKRAHLKGMSDDQGALLNVESGPKINLFKGDEIDPKWAPVPTWELHQEALCDCLQSAVDIYVDANVSIANHKFRNYNFY